MGKNISKFHFHLNYHESMFLFTLSQRSLAVQVHGAQTGWSQTCAMHLHLLLILSFETQDQIHPIVVIM